MYMWMEENATSGSRGKDKKRKVEKREEERTLKIDPVATYVSCQRADSGSRKQLITIQAALDSPVTVQVHREL